ESKKVSSTLERNIPIDNADATDGLAGVVQPADRLAHQDVALTNCAACDLPHVIDQFGPQVAKQLVFEFLAWRKCRFCVGDSPDRDARWCRGANPREHEIVETPAFDRHHRLVVVEKFELLHHELVADGHNDAESANVARGRSRLT